ncbi:Ycf20-like protein [Zea mays]|uniref:Ycf20-like protein n=1 Tax=Zea mays TaxID=4577 RepID=A0A1D6GG47_MAIZE|nr:Ycf20-like protein [Zea mays]
MLLTILCETCGLIVVSISFFLKKNCSYFPSLARVLLFVKF